MEDLYCYIFDLFFNYLYSLFYRISDRLQQNAIWTTVKVEQEITFRNVSVHYFSTGRDRILSNLNP